MKKIVWIAAGVGLFLYSAHGIGFSLSMFADLPYTFRFIKEQWFPLDASDASVAFKSLLITLQIAFFSTVAAVGVALPVGFLAARNWSPALWIYNSARMLLNLFRAIPELVLALLFIPTLGLGPMPAVMALFIHNLGVFGKLISEMIEAMDDGPQEAVKAVGGTRLQVAVFGILPQMLPLLLSQYFYRFEVAIRTSLILGVVGAGGIGQLLYNDFKQFMYEKVAFEVLLIMALITIVDYIGAVVRKRVT